MPTTELQESPLTVGNAVHSLAAIVPLFNEQKTVIELLTRLMDQPCISQIVIIDDGSTDDSVSLVKDWLSNLESAKAACVSLAQHDANRGKGRAIRTGLAVVECSHVIIQDADLEYDPADINKLWDVMKSSDADVVFGSRYLQKPRLEKGRLLLQTGVRFLNLLVRLLYRVRLTDEATCYKMFLTTDLRGMNLECEGFEFCPEVVAKSALNGLRLVEVPISYSPRDAASGKKITLGDGLFSVMCLVKHSPRLVSIVSLVLVTCLILLSYSWNSGHSVTQGVPTISHSHQLDLGEQRPGATVEKVFEIRNHSNSSWDVTGIEKRCGCVQAIVDNKLIRPGEILGGKVKVVMPKFSGRFDTLFNVQRKDIGGLTVLISANIRPEIWARKTRVKLTPEKTEDEIVIFHPPAATVELESDPSWCTVVERSSTVKATTFSIRMNESLPSRNRATQLIFQNPEGNSTVISVSYKADSDFHASPASLHLSEVVVGETRLQKIAIHHPKTHSPPRVLSTSQQIEVTVSKLKSGISDCSIWLTPNQQGFIDTSIELIFDEDNSITIPVAAHVIAAPLPSARKNEE